MRTWLPLFLVALAFAASSCGRSTLGDRCSTDSDCGDGFFCADGFCADEDPDNVSVNNINNENNTNSDECYENDEGICVFDPPCDGGSDECGPMVCDIGCPPDRVQFGCECEEIVCEDDGDCDAGLLCLDGICDNCKEDDQCPGGQVCSMGTCVDDSECQVDDDCLPSERCAPDGVCRDRRACVFDADCPDDELCFNGVCTRAPECQVDLDCPEGQECVGGRCFLALCRGPEDCDDGEVCDAGECVVPQEVVECNVATQDQLIGEGERIPLEAFAFNAAGAPVAATFAWTSDNPDVARAVPGPAALGGVTGGVATFTASTESGVPCAGAALLTNPGPVVMNGLRVVVSDIESGMPIANATVQVGSQSAITDAAGIANLTDPGGAYVVSVFAAGYNYITLRDVTATDIRVPVGRASGTGDVAGFTGEFDTSQLNSNGNITLGLAGSSIAGGLLELNLGGLLGDTFVSRLEIPGVVDEDIPLPGGLIAYGGAFGFMANIKEMYYAQGTGGPRMAWGLAGNLPFAELLDFFMGGGFDGNSIIAQLLPLFNRFDHAAFPSVFNELPRVVDMQDIDRDGDTTELLPDYDAFPVIDLTPSVRQNLVTDVGISNFPVLSDGETGVAVLVGGVVLPSPGFVPTGISATADDNGDGRPDLQRLSIAPSYGPLVGGRYAIVALTFGGGGGGGPGPGGFQLPDEFSVALWSGQSFPTSLSLGTFPDASQAFVTDVDRTVSVSATAGPLFRVKIVGADRSWDIWSVGPPGFMGQFGNQIAVPGSPVSVDDLFTSGEIFVDAIQTNVNLDDLVSSSGVGLKNAGLVSSAYNRTRVR